MLTYGDRERIDSLCNELWGSVFCALDAEANLSGDDAGAIAGNLTAQY